MDEVIRRLEPQLRAIASRMSTAHVDDLMAEMAVAILVLGNGNTDALYLRRAKDRARNYMRKEHRQLRDETLPHGKERKQEARAVPSAGELAYIFDQDEDLIRSNLGWD